MQGASEPLYMEFLDLVAAGTTPEEIIAFRPSLEAQHRVSELIDREKEVGLTAEETAELDKFMEFEHIVRMAKAKARMVLASRG
jgi:hypothetical protein